jgi:hypothetical protein
LCDAVSGVQVGCEKRGVYARECVCVCVLQYLCVCVRVRMCVSMRVCIYICVHVCVCAHGCMCLHGTWEGKSILGHSSDLADRLQRNAQTIMQYVIKCNIKEGLVRVESVRYLIVG